MCDRSITEQINDLHKDLLEARHERHNLAEELTRVQGLMGKLSLNVVSDAKLHVALENYLEFRESDLESDIRDLNEDIATIREDFNELKQEFAAEEEQVRQDFDVACSVLTQELTAPS
jgi:predicted  nucleic acid-binding Zn-ribbon protein